jgi:drug/metabolite transporter (DMT)-like permease
MMSQLVKGSILLAPVGVMNWPEIDLWMGWLIAGSGIASMLGNLLIVIAYRHAPASIMAPFIYMQLVGAAILGVIIFGDIPDQIAMIGIGLILASGFATLLLKRPT